MKYKLIYFASYIFISGCSKKTENNIAENGLIKRSPDRLLTIELQNFDDQDLQTRFKKYFGNAVVDRDVQLTHEKIQFIGNINNKHFDNIAIKPAIINQDFNKISGYALTSNTFIPSRNNLIGISCVSFPLIYCHSNFGFAAPDDYQQDHKNFDQFVSNLKNDLIVLDLCGFRVPKTFFTAFCDLKNVKSMTMPWFGVGLQKNVFKFPPNLSDLTIFNERMNGVFANRSHELDQIKSLILYGCWIDGDFSYPPFKVFEEFRNKTFQAPFSGVSNNVESIELIDCDNRIFTSLLHSNWNKLKSITILRSFDYPDQDGIDINYSIEIMLNKYANQFPELEKITLKFNDNSKLITPSSVFKKFFMNGSSESEIKKWLYVKTEIENVTKKAEFPIRFITPDDR